MASSNLSRTVLKSLQSRSFAAAAPAQAERLHSDNQRCSIKKLNNGMSVGVINSNSPVSRLAVVANAGSRFESGDNLGLSHFLRLSSRLRTQNLTSFALTRTTQQLGADITVMGTREYLYFKSGVTRNCADKMVEILQEMTTKQVYTPWEVNDVQTDEHGMPLDMALYHNRPQVRAMELLHNAAFRNTLGNSLYAPDHMVGKFTPEQISRFVKTHFSVGRMALIGIGVDQAQLEDLASQFEPFASAEVPVEKSAYHGGGELRENIGGDMSYVAVGFGGPSLTNKDLMAAEVLRHILGTGPHLKYSSGAEGSTLIKSVLQATDAPFHVSCLNATYTDNGLFGFSAVAHASQIEKVLQASANQMKASSNVTDQEVTRAKNQLKAEICMQFENPDVLLNWLGEQSLNGGGQVVTPEDIYKMVDGVNTNQVKEIAKSILSTRPSMACVGNVANVPYLDKLFS